MIALSVEARRQADRARAIEQAEGLGETVTDATAVIEPKSEAHKGESAWRGKIVSVTPNWCTEAPPLRRYLLRDDRTANKDGVLPRGKVGLLVSEGGGGKTMGLVQLAEAVANGGAWLDTFIVDKPGRALLVLGEEDEEEARRRIYNATHQKPVPPEGSITIVPLHSIPCAFLDRDECGRAIETLTLADMRDWIAAAGPFDLIAFDPASRFGGPDFETDNAVATRFVQAVESIAELTGAATLIAHHTNKPSRTGGVLASTSARGSSALHDGVRWMATLGVDKAESGVEIITFAVAKSNYSKRGEPLLLRREDGGRLVPLDADESERAIALVSGEAARQGKQAQREQEAEAARVRRAERKAEEQAEKERKRAEDAQAQRKREEEALVRVLRERPGIHTDELRSALAAQIGGCTRERMKDILARCAADVKVYTPEGGPVNARAYRLAGELL